MKNATSSLLTLNQVCDMLNVHKNTLRIWDEKGVLKAIRFGRRQDRRYKREEVLQLLQNRKGQDTDTYSNNIRVLKAEQAVDRLARLQLINSSLATVLEPKKVARIIVEQAVGALQASAGVIYCVSDNKKQLEILSSIGYDKKLIEKLATLPINRKIPTTEVAKLGEPLFFETYAEILLHFPLAANKSLASINQAYTGLPLKIRGEINGVLTLGFEEAMHFSKDDITFMLALAHQCELAFERAELYEQEKKAKEQAEITQGKLVKILEGVSDAFIAYDENWRYTYINQRAENLIRKKRLELLGKVMWNIHPKVKKTEAGKKFVKAMENRKPATFQTYYEPLHGEFNVRVYPSPTGLITIFQPI